MPIFGAPISFYYFLLIYKQQRPHIKFKLKAIDDAYLSRFASIGKHAHTSMVIFKLGLVMFLK